MEIVKYTVTITIIYFLYKLFTIIKIDEQQSLFKYLIKKFFSFISLDDMYKMVSTLLFIVFITICFYLFDSTDDNFIKLLAPLGIILSASIASLSVLKSIQNTNNIEEVKNKKEEESYKNKLTLYLTEIKNFVYIYESAYLSFKKNNPAYLNTNFTISLIKEMTQKKMNLAKNLMLKDTDFISKSNGKSLINIISFINNLELFFYDVKDFDITKEIHFDDGSDDAMYFKEVNELILRANYMIICIVSCLEQLENKYLLKLNLEKTIKMSDDLDYCEEKIF